MKPKDPKDSKNPREVAPKEAKSPREDKDTEDLDVVGPFIGWHRTNKGWVVIMLHVQGDRVVEREIVAGPAVRLIAEHELKLAIARRLLALKS